ncbi:MAG: hypothetical protein IPJ62_11805 [Betaproteobacteria bacterium]|nr:hypothetical protein [Betaproteobacteria bacterium]
MKPTAPYTDLGGEQLIEWGGALRWLARAGTRPAEAARVGGRARRARDAVPRDEQGAGVFQPLADTLLGLHRRLKAVFDPQGILNRGRLYPGL